MSSGSSYVSDIENRGSRCQAARDGSRSPISRRGGSRYPSPGSGLTAESCPPRQLDRLMWAQAYDAMERAQRLHRQFFHRAHSAPCWEAPVDIFETENALTIVIALPGVDPEQVQVTLSAGVLIVSGERPLPGDLTNARIHRLEIPHGHFQRRIELPPVRVEISGRHLANGCLMLQLHKS